MMSTYVIEKILAVIKPCATQHRFSILRRIFSSGFHILQVKFFSLPLLLSQLTFLYPLNQNPSLICQERCVKLSVAQVEDFLSCKLGKDKNKSDKDKLAINVDEWSSGPLIALCLSRDDAIELWNKLMGPEDCDIARESAPTSIRAMYGFNGNPTYGSKCLTQAQRELQFFFPSCKKKKIHINLTFFLFISLDTPTVSFEFDVNIDEINEYLRNTIYHPLTNALHAMLHSKPDETIEFIAKYILKHNVNQPIIQSTCTNALHLLQRLKDEEECKHQLDKNRQLSEMKANAKCGCSLTSSSVSTLSSS